MRWGEGEGSSLLKLKSVEKHNGGASDRSSVSPPYQYNVLPCFVSILLSNRVS